MALDIGTEVCQALDSLGVHEKQSTFRLRSSPMRARTTRCTAGFGSGAFAEVYVTSKANGETYAIVLVLKRRKVTRIEKQQSYFDKMKRRALSGMRVLMT